MKRVRRTPRWVMAPAMLAVGVFIMAFLMAWRDPDPRMESAAAQNAQFLVEEIQKLVDENQQMARWLEVSAGGGEAQEH